MTVYATRTTPTAHADRNCPHIKGRHVYRLDHTDTDHLATCTHGVCGTLAKGR